MRIRHIILSLAITIAGISAEAQQLPNMGFDQWSKKNGCWNPYPKDSQATTWDTANHGLSMFGINGATPEYEHVAVPGPGKAAVKVETKQTLGILVAGTIYTGKFLKIVKMSGAKIQMGVPFTGRPKSLSLYRKRYMPTTVPLPSRSAQLRRSGMPSLRIIPQNIRN